jgi:type I site-specific restriction-modification system R (restriction) subunit
MIHKFEGIDKDANTRSNIYVFIDEAHRSIAKDRGTYMMAAVPNATIIGFTGTPIARTAQGEGTFKIFGSRRAFRGKRAAARLQSLSGRAEPRGLRQMPNTSALDKLLPPEWSEAVSTENAANVIDRTLVAELQISEQRESDVRLLFKKANETPKILIVTHKLLTGYDAPLLYCMYLDKPMRDHVLLQAIARVNRPYVDANGVQKRVGLVIDFVGVLRELKEALQFDSADVRISTCC